MDEPDGFDRLFLALLLVVTGSALSLGWPLDPAFDLLYAAAALVFGALVARSFRPAPIPVATAVSFVAAGAAKAAALVGVAAAGTVAGGLLALGVLGAAYLDRRG